MWVLVSAMSIVFFRLTRAYAVLCLHCVCSVDVSINRHRESRFIKNKKRKEKNVCGVKYFCMWFHLCMSHAERSVWCCHSFRWWDRRVDGG
jgi:hypothetical protein